MPFSRENRHTTLALLALVLGLSLVTAGILFYFSQEAQAEQDRKDRLYAVCLNDWADEMEVWGQEVTITATKRSAVSRALDEARDRKDSLLDHLIVLSNRAQQLGAESQDDLSPKFIKDYERTLADRVAAQKRFDRLKRQAEQTVKENTFPDPPEVRCSR